MLSVFLCPKIITLSGFHYIHDVFHNQISDLVVAISKFPFHFLNLKALICILVINGDALLMPKHVDHLNVFLIDLESNF